MELYFLGTGAGMPSKERNVTSVMLNLLAERNVYWMFDCGEGSQHQILRAPVKISKLEKLFVTHLHGDHIYGSPGAAVQPFLPRRGHPFYYLRTQGHQGLD
ncbi:MBL fold metallo-hydrolase [Paenibacillus sp. P25]|nr:MBL fold metallo-hydrolase [Paenibacillus sp. P25]